MSFSVNADFATFTVKGPTNATTAAEFKHCILNDGRYNEIRAHELYCLHVIVIKKSLSERDDLYYLKPTSLAQMILILL